MTHRYQCPRCERMHDRDREPKCPTHGFGYSGKCGTCVELAHKPCPGGQS